MHRSPVPAAALWLAGVATMLAGCIGAAPSSQEGIGAIVMVSGRDDHGLLQLPEVPLYTEQEGSEVAGYLADGSFAEVLAIHGTWLHVRSVADPALSGWIDDFYLRDRAVAHNTQQVRFVAARPGEPVEVKVQAVDGNGPEYWIPADHLVEVGADVEPHDH